MIQKIKFCKEKHGKWYLDSPESEMEEDLKMSQEFDFLLNSLCQGEDVVYLQIGDEKFPGSNPLIFVSVGSNPSGGWYVLPSYGDKELNLKLFLGESIRSIFGHFPETIWFYKSF
jgi:hypothetical protein